MVAAGSLIKAIYDETLALLEEARYQARRGLSANRPSDRSIDISEVSDSLRVTARLSHVMAWVLARRAVEAGEISEDAGRAEQYRLDGRDVCFRESDDDPDRPLGLRRLLEQSLALYTRIARLDDLIPRPAGAASATA
ncbi:MAG: DUF1465 family protein [Alphaproteobacteria bacterium]|nr:DUF1465 family protein [Alphaproteobacteria bacterium]